MAYPPGEVTVGRDAIRALWEQVLAKAPALRARGAAARRWSAATSPSPPRSPRDGTGVRAQVARRQPDGTWLRLLDQPEIGPPVQR